jgi:Zn-dependent M28 family amino/carboxypeptidase
MVPFGMNCLKCKHFFITWNQNAPRGCKLYGFESKKFPSAIVAASTPEKTCLGFELKQSPDKADSNVKRNLATDFHFD